MRSFTFIFLALCLIPLAAAQTDHDNIDAGRPLRFDDAEPIATGGLAFEFGLGASFMRRTTVFDAPFELIWGGMPDTQFEIGLATRFGSRSDRFLQALDLAVLHSFRREVRNAPALAMKLEASLPPERGGATAYRIRGIASKAAKQYDRLHLNVDVDLVPGAPSGERRARLGAVLGYTKPIGYFTSFDTTMLAELAVYQGVRNGDGGLGSLGIGVRRQVSPRSVVDIGLQSDFSIGRGGTSVPIRLIGGYSTSF
ncbi:MAG: hypothetical protein WAO58_01840 [Fimbriimonadaceae bacterium]